MFEQKMKPNSVGLSTIAKKANVNTSVDVPTKLHSDVNAILNSQKIRMGNVIVSLYKAIQCGDITLNHPFSSASNAPRVSVKDDASVKYIEFRDRNGNLINKTKFTNKDLFDL